MFSNSIYNMLHILSYVNIKYAFTIDLSVLKFRLTKSFKTVYNKNI